MRPALSIILVALFHVSLVRAGAEGRIRVATVAPTASPGHLGAAVECASIFSPKSLSTLQSGLSAVLRLELRLERSGGTRTLMGGSGEFEVVRDTERARSIAYDVWDERYTVSGSGKREVFETLDRAQGAVATFEHRDMATLVDLEPGLYRLRARVQLLPVSPEQGERVAAWLQGSGDAGQEAGPSGRRGAEFNVGNLLSMLWGRGQNQRDRSAWATSESFEVDAATGVIP